MTLAAQEQTHCSSFSEGELEYYFYPQLVREPTFGQRRKGSSSSPKGIRSVCHRSRPQFCEAEFRRCSCCLEVKSRVVLRRGTTGLGLRGVAYLCFCTPARLLRHIPRQKKPIIPIPIMATPSFMPNQTESNESTVHQPFSRCKQPVAHRFVGTPESRSTPQS